MSFDNLGLLPELLRAVSDEGYTTPTPIQEKAIPLVLAGRDLLAAAQTGTGKTAAFVLPLLQLLHAQYPAQELAPRAPAPLNHGRQQRTGVRGMVRPASRNGVGGGRSFAPVAPQPVLPPAPVRVLVLVPTRELALQVEESVKTYGRHKPVGSLAIYGGVGFDPQVRALRAGAPIVVATPGRLLDHVGQGTIDLSRVTHLVLDEADRMLDMGFIRDIRRVLELLPERRQNLLFSATFSNEIRSLAAGLLHDPASVEVAPRNTAAELIDQLVIPVDRGRKVALLTELFARGRVTSALVFARTKHGANRLAGQLEDAGIATAAIHGNKSQPQRIKALDDFKAGRVSFLVATDIAARGIDIESLPHVVNFELPMVAEDYVHRIGRTGRAGVDGQAISLVCIDEQPLLRDIQALLRRTIPSEVIQGFEPDRSIAAEPIRLRSGERGGGRMGSGRFGGGGRPNPAGGRPSPAPAVGRANAGVTGGRPHGEGRPSGGRPESLPGRSIGQVPAASNRPAAASSSPRPANGSQTGVGQPGSVSRGVGNVPAGRPAVGHAQPQAQPRSGGPRPTHGPAAGAQRGSSIGNGGPGVAGPRHGSTTPASRAHRGSVPAPSSSGPRGGGPQPARQPIALPGERLSRAPQG